jgi:serine/threonine-protein kinase
MKFSYTNIRKIGEGGFGEVWEALRSDGVKVAIKYLHAGSDADAKNRFRKEVVQLQEYEHPNVVKILDSDLSATPPYFVMKLMPGGSLTKLAGRLGTREIRRVLCSVVDVLRMIHSTGGMHRDIKPDNILIDGDGALAVGDFGLGNNPQFTMMFTAHACGTYGYVAPELAMNGTASAASDVYSLGATIFHLITGVKPESMPPLDPKAVGVEATAELRDLVVRMTHLDANRRPTSAQLATELGLPALPAKPPVTATPKAPEPTAGFTERNKTTTLSGGRYG